MGSLRFTDLQTRPTEVLDLTSLTLDECQRLVAPCEAAFQAHMAAWRRDGQPRTARGYTTYKVSFNQVVMAISRALLYSPPGP
jgi:hypothetical protein